MGVGVTGVRVYGLGCSWVVGATVGRSVAGASVGDAVFAGCRCDRCDRWSVGCGMVLPVAGGVGRATTCGCPPGCGWRWGFGCQYLLCVAVALGHLQAGGLLAGAGIVPLSSEDAEGVAG